VSAFFQPAARHGYVGPTTTLDDLHRRFADRLDHVPLQWFESRLEPALGIDVYDHGFDPSVGYQIISTDTVRLLVLRCEDLHSAPRGLAELLDRDRPVPVPQLNVGADKEYGGLYQGFLRSLHPSEAQLDRAYTSRLVRHFYTPTEIDRFRTRWTIDVSIDGTGRGNGDEVRR
jgi:hypothetical protein